MLLDGLRRAAHRLLGHRAQRALRLRAHRGAARPGVGDRRAERPGGVVNLVSKRPQAERGARSACSSATTTTSRCRPTSPARSMPMARCCIAWWRWPSDSGTQVDHAYDDRDLVAPSLTWRPNARHLAHAVRRIPARRERQPQRVLPGARHAAAGAERPDPDDTFIGEPDWDTYGGTRSASAGSSNSSSATRWTLRHSLRHDRTDGKMRTMYAGWYDGFVDATGAADPNGTYLNRIWYASDDTRSHHQRRPAARRQAALRPRRSTRCCSASTAWTRAASQR